MAANKHTFDIVDANVSFQQPHLARNHPYYRPKTYVAKTGTNPLVTAAAPLFTLLIALQHTQHYANSATLYQHLVHEIKAFESTALAKDYPYEFVTVARYALCATLDETIQVTQWGKQLAWDKQNLLTAFQQENSANDRFFSILDQLRNDPAHYIDILEIMYLCLSLGFEGRYRCMPDARHEFERLLDDVYHLICNERGHVKKRLSVCRHWQKPHVAKKVRAPSLWRTGIIGTIMIGLLYTTFNYTLVATTRPLTHSLQQLSFATAADIDQSR